MNAAEITPKIAAMMGAMDRKALGVLTLVERERKVEGIAERELQRLCEQELSRRGIVFLHLSFRAREKIGWPDLTFVLPAGEHEESYVVHGKVTATAWFDCTDKAPEPIPMAIELKTAFGRLTVDQERLLERMAMNGWKTYVCRSFERFIEIITEVK